MRYVAIPLLLLLCGTVLAEEEDVRRPNVVVLYADDAGYADFGFQSETASDVVGLTPHIDSIAKDGIRFANAYMSGCVCSPSRAGLMTGRHQCRFGHEQNIPPGYVDGGMELSEKTIADRLAALGYDTALVGKWHLGYPAPYQPNQRGFAWFHGLLQGARPYFPMETPTPHKVIQENGKPLPESGYVTDRFGDAAVRYIAEHREKPFFLFVSFTAPHGPLQAKESDLETLARIPPGKRRRYAGLVKCLDDNVGRILAALEEQGLAKDTLVVFTNDNGGQTKTGAVNTPLRGRKGQLLEGGIRVPMAMRWPGVLAAGRTSDDPVVSLDFLPTFVALAGGRVDPAWELDGTDLLPLLEGEAESLPERPLFWRKDGDKGEIAMRLGRWKLHVPDRSETTRPALYDLEVDRGEAADRAEAHPERVKRMLAALADWEKDLESPRWRYGRARRPAR